MVLLLTPSTWLQAKGPSAALPQLRPPAPSSLPAERSNPSSPSPKTPALSFLVPFHSVPQPTGTPRLTTL